MDERIISSRLCREEFPYENNLRPEKLQDFIGQDNLKDKLISILCRQERGEPLDHVLLHGRRVWETTLANIISGNGVNIRITSGPAMKGRRPGSWQSISSQKIFFLSTKFTGLTAAWKSSIPPWKTSPWIIIGKGPGARSLRLDLAPFTLIGANKTGLISSPLRGGLVLLKE